MPATGAIDENRTQLQIACSVHTPTAVRSMKVLVVRREAAQVASNAATIIAST
jgi:hypothetical protein